MKNSIHILIRCISSAWWNLENGGEEWALTKNAQRINEERTNERVKNGITNKTRMRTNWGHRSE